MTRYPPWCVASSLGLLVAGLVREGRSKGEDLVSRFLILLGCTSAVHHARLDGDWYRKDWIRTLDVAAACTCAVVAHRAHAGHPLWTFASLYAALVLLCLHLCDGIHARLPYTCTALHASTHVVVAAALVCLSSSSSSSSSSS